MTRVTNLDRYPKQYLDIASQFEGDGTTPGVSALVLGPFDSRAAASSKRLDLYAFRAALEKSGFKDDYPRFAAVRMSISAKAPWKLTLTHADAPTEEMSVKVKA